MNTVLQQRVADIILAAVEEERARLRRELLAAAEEAAWDTTASTGAQLPGCLVVDLDDVRAAALDKIAPEEVSHG
jgi:hypothetical protein